MNYLIRNGILQQRNEYFIIKKDQSSFSSLPTRITIPTINTTTKTKSNNNMILNNINSDKIGLKNLYIEIEKVVEDIERDNIGNKWNSKILITGFIHQIEHLSLKNNKINTNKIIPNSLIDLCFKFYYVSTKMIIDETLIKIEIGLKIIKIYDDYDDDKQWIKSNNNKLIKKRVTMNPKYKRNFKQLKDRLKWCQIW